MLYSAINYINMLSIAFGNDMISYMSIDMMRTYFIVYLLFFVGFVIISYVFLSIGLYTMSKHQNYEKPWIAFIPIANLYLAGKLAGHMNVFGFNVKNVGLWLAIVSLIFAVCDAYVDFVMCFNYSYNLIVNRVIVAQPDYQNGMSVACTVIYGISAVIDIAKLVLSFGLYVTLFRRYNPRYGFVLSFVSFFASPAFGIIVFALRNRQPVNVEEYLRNSTMNYNMRYGNPYMNDRYSNNQNSQENYNNNQPQEDPFAEFSNDKNEDPFNNDFN